MGLVFMRIISIALALVALGFVACGDDSNSSAPSVPVEMGEFVDARDNQTYKIVVIGSQTWMAENLNYETENSFCYNDEYSYCTQYGRFYTWTAAMSACPAGWHLPTKEEFETLINAVGDSITAGKKLKASSGWFANNGTDAYGFGALPAGDWVVGNWGAGSYSPINTSAWFWTSTEEDSLLYYALYLYYYDDNVTFSSVPERVAISVRCVKD